MDHPIPIRKLSSQVAKLCGPDTSPQMKELAAGGLAPLGPVDLVTVLYVLAYDSDEKMAQTARKSLLTVPEIVLHGALEQLTNEQVLDGLAQLLLPLPEAMQIMMLNQHVVPETVIWVAKRSDDDRTLENIATNEERMLGFPKIIEALYNNKHSRMSTVDRAIELAARNNVELHGIACYAEAKAAIQDQLLAETAKEKLPQDEAFIANLESATWKELDDESVDEAYEDKDGTSGKKKKVESVEQALGKLNVSAKIRVATLGNSTQRSVLIRDSNKLVIMAVVKSPSLKESEVMRFAKFRSLPVEAVRYIGSNREFTKHYTVKLNLVQNPRCPIEIALRFLPHIRLNDLKLLARDKNVPQAVARAAKNFVSKRLR